MTLLLTFAASAAVGQVSLQERADLAKKALLSGHAREAVTRYKALARELPDDPGMRLNLALALESAGQYSEEIQQLELVLDRQPKMFAAWLMLGMAHRKLGHGDAAVEPLRRALSISPGDRMALLEMGDAQLAVSDFPQAAEAFQRLVSRYQDAPQGWKGLVLAYTALAGEAFVGFGRTAPGSAEWCLLAGRSELNNGQFARAFGLFRQALKQEPDLRGVHAALAQVYEKTSHPDWAAVERSREGSSNREPNREPNRESPQESFRRAEEYQQLAADALVHLERLPESAELLELRAESDQRQGRRAEALSEWRRAGQLAPADRRLQGRLAESLWINRSYEEAQQLLTRLVASDPNQANWQYLLGDVLFRQQKSEQALPYLQAAIRLEPPLREAHAVLGRIYLQLGQASRAIPHLEKGLSTDEAAISFQLGQAYRAMGQQDLAAKAFRRQRELLQTQTETIEITPPEE